MGTLGAVPIWLYHYMLLYNRLYFPPHYSSTSLSLDSDPPSPHCYQNHASQYPPASFLVNTWIFPHRPFPRDPLPPLCLHSALRLTANISNSEPSLAARPPTGFEPMPGWPALTLPDRIPGS